MPSLLFDRERPFMAADVLFIVIAPPRLLVSMRSYLTS